MEPHQEEKKNNTIIKNSGLLIASRTKEMEMAVTLLTNRNQFYKSDQNVSK
jgi:hypothetical protein